MSANGRAYNGGKYFPFPGNVLWEEWQIYVISCAKLIYQCWLPGAQVGKDFTPVSDLGGKKCKHLLAVAAVNVEKEK